MPSFLDAIVGWLREGYPQGVPEQDYMPLFALLRRRLTDEEVAAVANQLVSDGSIEPDTIDIGTLITKITAEMPYESDIDRVREHLPLGL